MKKPPTTQTRPATIKLNKEISVSSEISKLVALGVINEVFGESLKMIIQDHLSGKIAGRQLPDTFIELVKKYTNHGVIQIGGTFFQMLVMVRENDTSTRHHWKLVQLDGEGFYFKELSSL